MKRITIALTIAATLTLLLVGTAFAQDGEPIEVANLFTWALYGTPDWGQGALFAGLGLVGALVTVFGLVGGAVPGTAGFARIDAGLKRVEEREKALDRLINDSHVDAGKIRAIEMATNNLRDDLTADRRRQFATAGILYAILGAFFAAMLARDLLQALVIGAGWTAYMGALGLKRDYAERKSVKDDTTQRLEEALSEVRSQAESRLRDADSWEDDDFFGDYEDLRLEAQVAKAL